jgi:hypothetical protein
MLLCKLNQIIIMIKNALKYLIQKLLCSNHLRFYKLCKNEFVYCTSDSSFVSNTHLCTVQLMDCIVVSRLGITWNNRTHIWVACFRSTGTGSINTRF